MYYKVYEISGKEMDVTHNVHGGDMTVFCEGCLSSLAAILYRSYSTQNTYLFFGFSRTLCSYQQVYLH